MGVYYMNEAAFELPDIGLADRTVTRLDVITPEGRSHAVLLQRTPIPEGGQLDDLVTANLREAVLRHRAHRVLFRRDAEIAGRPAIEIGAQWDGGVRVIYTRQAHLVRGGVWLAFSAHGPIDDRATADAHMDHLLATLHLRD
jgi:hypothetical protein